MQAGDFRPVCRHNDGLPKSYHRVSREDGMTKAFLRMDTDIGKAAEAKIMMPAMSGAVACVALICGRDLYVAGTGDCGAVLGHQVRPDKKNRLHHFPN